MLATFTLALATSALAPPVALVVPELAASGVDPSVASSISAHLVRELAKTPVEMLHAELGDCADDACAAELARALKADAILLGRVSKLGDEYHVELKVLDEGEGKLLTIYSVDAGEARLGEQLSRAADVVANAVLVAHDRLGIDMAEIGIPSSRPSPSRRPSLPKHALTFSPLALLVGFFGVEYEGVLNDQLSAFGSATLIWFYFDRGLVSAQGYLLSLGVRWYPWREAPSGLFLDVEARFGDSRIHDLIDEDMPLTYGAFAILPSAMVGYTFLVGEVPISLGLGLGYNGILDYWYLSEIGPILRINTGIAF